MLCLRGSFGLEAAEQTDSLKWQKSTKVGPEETSKNCRVRNECSVRITKPITYHLTWELAKRF